MDPAKTPGEGDGVNGPADSSPSPSPSKGRNAGESLLLDRIQSFIGGVSASLFAPARQNGQIVGTASDLQAKLRNKMTEFNVDGAMGTMQGLVLDEAGKASKGKGKMRESLREATAPYPSSPAISTTLPATIRTSPQSNSSTNNAANKISSPDAASLATKLAHRFGGNGGISTTTILTSPRPSTILPSLGGASPGDGRRREEEDKIDEE